MKEVWGNRGENAAKLETENVKFLAEGQRERKANKESLTKPRKVDKRQKQN